MVTLVTPERTTTEKPTGTRTITGGALACEALLAAGATVLFGYPGGAALPFYRELARYPRLRHILVRHEQNAAHAADGYARATGRVGVCVATSGPGATNLLTGLATAFMDCVPVVALTGQVARAAIGTQAFQEVDVVGMVGPITKGAFQLKSADEIRTIYEARGVLPSHEVIAYCQVGMRASVDLFALHLIGYDKLRNYLGSWEEWGNRDDLPIGTKK